MVDEALKKEIKQKSGENPGLAQLMAQIPEFPKKKIFTQTNQDVKSIQERQLQLEIYFNRLFSVQQFLETEIILYFIENSKLIAEMSNFNTYIEYKLNNLIV